MGTSLWGIVLIMAGVATASVLLRNLVMKCRWIPFWLLKKLGSALWWGVTRLPIPTWTAALPGLAFTLHPIWTQWRYNDYWQLKVAESRQQIATWQQTLEFQEWTLWLYERMIGWFPWAQSVSDVDGFRQNLVTFVLRPYWTMIEAGGTAFLFVFVLLSAWRMARWGRRKWRGESPRYFFGHYWLSEALFSFLTLVVIAIGLRAGWLAQMQANLEDWIQLNLVLSDRSSLKQLGLVLQDNLLLSCTLVVVLTYLVWNTTCTIKEWWLRRREMVAA